jgi:HD-like signal output (HDOD) protein
LANSAQFGLPRSVASLDEAIALVGMSKVRTLSLASCMNDSFPVLPGLDSAEFWKGSMACAGYAQWLALRVVQDSQQAWLAGMMLRLGEILIGQADPQALLEIEKLPHLPGGRWEREVHLVGFSEGQVTAELARRWNFPISIVDALQQSPDPLAQKKYSRMGAVLHLAGVLADVPEGGTKALDALPKDVLAALELERQWLEDKIPAAGSFISLT